MAQLMMCPQCRQDLGPGEICENCFVSAVPRPVEGPAAVTESVPGAGPGPGSVPGSGPGSVPGSGPASTAARDCADPDCRFAGTVPDYGCSDCGLSRPQRASAQLVFPWGAETMPADGSTLHLGREGSPLARRLAEYSNVSRHHADISLAAGLPVLVDLDSANGTYVNEQPIPARQPRPLNHGDRIRLARDLVITVDLGAPR